MTTVLLMTSLPTAHCSTFLSLQWGRLDRSPMVRSRGIYGSEQQQLIIDRESASVNCSESASTETQIHSLFVISSHESQSVAALR